jgi:DNA polymerase III alpha subunit (gram-positive type)
MSQFDFLWLDVETTGLHPGRSGIVSLAGLANWETDPAKSFYSDVRVFADAEINEGALHVNGFTRDQIFDITRPPEVQVCEAFKSWILASFSGPPIICGMNTQFDINFVNEMFRRCGVTLGLRSRFVDVQDVAIFLHTAGLIVLEDSGSTLRTNLGSLLRVLAPGTERSEEHTCYEDIWLTRSIYIAMLNRVTGRG